MKRRRFIQSAAGASAIMLLSRPAVSRTAPFRLNYAPHEGLFENSAGPSAAALRRRDMQMGVSSAPISPGHGKSRAGAEGEQALIDAYRASDDF